MHRERQSGSSFLNALRNTTGTIMASLLSLNLPLIVLIMLFEGPVWLSADKPTLQEIQETYKNESRPGNFMCYYAMPCQRDEEVCIHAERACASLFQKGATEDEKFNFCCIKQINNKTTTSDPQSYDPCLYRFGEMWSEKNIDNCSMPLRKIQQDAGVDLCPFGNLSSKSEEVYTYCKRGQEYCTPKGCQPLFDDAEKSDEEKQTYCQEIIKRQERSNRYDACIYALGLLRINTDQAHLQELQGIHARIDNITKYMEAVKCNKTSDNKASEAETTVIWPYPVISILAIALIVAVVSLVIVCFKVKKLFCFKAPKRPELPDAEAAVGDDENRQNERLLNDQQAPNDNMEHMELRDVNDGRGDDNAQNPENGGNMGDADNNVNNE